MAASNFHVALGRAALFSKILGVPLSFIFFLCGSGSIGTFLMYLWMVRQEYTTIPAMRSVFGELRIRLDEGMLLFPDKVQYFYNKAKELIIHYDKIMN
jgi:hypothetical protein